MIGGGKVLAVIPARGGSKGVPRKNVRLAHGRPLLAWTVDAAKASRYVDRVIVSTEDDEIAKVALECGADVPFMRPHEFARDETPGVVPALHALEMLPEYEWLILLQPTSPLRISIDVDACLARCVETGAPACVTVTIVSSPPELMFRLDSDFSLAPVLGWGQTSARRQELCPTYALNGAVYVARCEWLRGAKTFVCPSTVAVVMPEERSLDIDIEHDFRMFELMGARQGLFGPHTPSGLP